MKPPGHNPSPGDNGKHFTPGFDPRRSPGGRPRGQSAFRKACRGYTIEALEALRAALASPGERVTAAKVLLEFGWGKPEAMSKNIANARQGGNVPTAEEAAAAAAELRKLSGLDS